MNDQHMPPEAELEALRKRIAELEAAQRTTANTQGGAFIAGGVQTQGGHFIGRDFIQSITQVIHAGEHAEEVQEIIALYLHALANDLAGLKLGEIDTATDQSKQSPLQLADIYVPLDTTLRLPKNLALKRWLDFKPDRCQHLGVEREERPVSALEALACHRELTLLGKPGSGKSTFGASVLLALAQTWQGRAEALADLGADWEHGALFPIRAILRRFSEQLPPGDAPARAGDLWAFIGRDLQDAGYGLSADVMKYVQRLARKHGVLILLDGLDECGDEHRRGRVLAAVRELMGNAGPNSRFLLTARPYAWPGGADADQGVYLLADLNEAQVERFIGAWYDALVTRHWQSPGDAAKKRDDLLAARHRRDLAPLAANPLLLTLMATLHSNLGHLPDDRADLYDKAVDLLLARWNRRVGAEQALLDALALPGLKLSDLRAALEDLAFTVHAASVGRDGAADIPEHYLVNAFKPLLGGSKDKADLVVAYVEKRAGLLLGQGEKDHEAQFTFPHRTFQEFLAACHLARGNDLSGRCLELARADLGHWREVLILAARLAGNERGASAADELVGRQEVEQLRHARQPHAQDWALAELAGRQLLEIGLRALSARDSGPVILRRVAGWLAAGLPVPPTCGGWPAPQRAQAGDLLAALGDSRFDPAHWYLPAEENLGFVRIEADPGFRIGTLPADQQRIGADDDEINDQPTPTRAFYIARYPVTVAQFRAFVKERKYQLGDPGAPRDPDSRPVRWVSWQEALDYCAWLQQRLAERDGPIADLLRQGGWRLTLPSELEWEKAARGGHAGRAYPWGDEADPEKANYDDTGIGDTSAVGCFPANDYGLHDMSGNVWEWTRSLWGKEFGKPEFGYPYSWCDAARENLEAGDDMRRVVRGGAWLNHRDLARCAIRRRPHPDARAGGLGFRVVLSPV